MAGNNIVQDCAVAEEELRLLRQRIEKAHDRWEGAVVAAHDDPDRRSIAARDAAYRTLYELHQEREAGEYNLDTLRFWMSN